MWVLHRFTVLGSNLVSDYNHTAQTWVGYKPFAQTWVGYKLMGYCDLTIKDKSVLVIIYYSKYIYYGSSAARV